MPGGKGGSWPGGLFSVKREMAQITSGGCHIAADLFAQGLGRGPLALIAQAGEESQTEGRDRVKRDRAEVQQVAFDGERGISKGGAGADVGDRVEAEFVGRARCDCHARDINAGGGNQAIVAGEIDSGHSEAAADAASRGWCAEDGKWPAQEPAGAAYVSHRNKLADAAAGGVHSAHLERFVDVDGEAELLAEGAELVHAGLRTKPEAEVVALMHLDGAQALE